MNLVSSEFMPHTKHEWAKIIYYVDVIESNLSSSYDLFFLRDTHYTEADVEILGDSFINSYQKIIQHFDLLSFSVIESCDVVDYVLKKIVELLDKSHTFLKIRLDVVYMEKGGGVRQDYLAFCITESLCRVLQLELNPKPRYLKYIKKIDFGFDDFDNVIRGFFTKRHLIKRFVVMLENENERKDMLTKIDDLFSRKFDEETPRGYTESDLKYLKMTEPVILIV